MTERTFSQDDLEAIDAIWRSLPDNDNWVGWAATANQADTVWLFRKRANWRRFLLRKTEENQLVLHDEERKQVGTCTQFEELPKVIDDLPQM